MSKFWSRLVRALVPYVPGEQPKIPDIVKLNTNENPYAPSPAVLAAIQAELNEDLRLYPDPNAELLKESIARYYSVDNAMVFVGNGSDEVLAHVFNGLLKHDLPILFPDITYSFYPVYCGLYDVRFQTVPLNDTFEIEPAQYTQPNGGIIFPNPNAPTGVLTALSQIETILQANADSVVVIDEAYIDFGGDSAIELTARYPNLLVVQTLSKSRSLAGLRVGFAIGHPDLIEALERIKNSFNSYPLGRMAIAGAAAAMDDIEYFQKTTSAVIKSRQKLCSDLTAMGFFVLPSAANFIFARHPEYDGAALAQSLREQSVIVRRFQLPRIEQYLRITIGSDQQNNVLVSALKAILKR